MRAIPVDTSKLQLIATGKIAPKPKYAKLADGTSKRVDGQQDTDDMGNGLWVIDCMVDDGADDEDGRAEIVGVTVASPDRPKVTKFAPVAFVDLVATVYRDRMTGQPKTSFKASGIKPATSAKAA
jgi:hypothetical protein